jgi:hypothetical protein
MAWACKASLDVPQNQVRGTRVPVAALFENLEDGVSMTALECGGLLAPSARAVINRWQQKSPSIICQGTEIQLLLQTIDQRLLLKIRSQRPPLPKYLLFTVFQPPKDAIVKVLTSWNLPWA